MLPEILREIIDVLQSIGAICPNKKAELHAAVDQAARTATPAEKPAEVADAAPAT